MAEQDQMEIEEEMPPIVSSPQQTDRINQEIAEALSINPPAANIELKHDAKYSIREDLTILNHLKGNSNPEVRKQMAALSKIMGRSAESLRQRYKRHIKLYTSQKILQMCAALKRGDQYLVPPKPLKPPAEPKPPKAAPAPKPPKPEKIKKEVIMMEEECIDIINRLTDYRPPEIKRGEGTIQQHTLIQNPEDEEKERLRILTQKLNINQQGVMQLLHRCSLKPEIIETVLEQPDLRATLLWEADEDEFLISSIRESQEHSLQVLKKFKGDENVDARIEYLSRMNRI